MRGTVLRIALVATLFVGVVAVGVGPADSDTSALLWDEERADAEYNATAVNGSTGEVKTNICAGSGCTDSNTSTNDSASIRSAPFTSLAEQSASGREYHRGAATSRTEVGAAPAHRATDSAWTARVGGVPTGDRSL